LDSRTRGQTRQLGPMTVRVLIIPLVQNMDKNTLGTAQSHQGDALCAEEKIIGGETTSTLGKGIITMVEEVIIRRTILTGTLDRYKALGNRVKATSS